MSALRDKQLVTLAIETAARINDDGETKTVLADAEVLLAWMEGQLSSMRERDPLRRAQIID
jgi:hypothetical protein